MLVTGTFSHKEARMSVVTIIEVAALYISFALAAAVAIIERNGRFRLTVEDWMSILLWPCAIIVGAFKKLLP